MTTRILRHDRGAITIHVALALMALLMFSSIVVDYGVMWVSRRQAQNAADAAALAGAIALVKDGGSTPNAKVTASFTIRAIGRRRCSTSTSVRRPSCTSSAEAASSTST